MTNLTLEYDIYKILKNYKYMQLMMQHNVYYMFQLMVFSY